MIGNWNDDVCADFVCQLPITLTLAMGDGGGVVSRDPGASRNAESSAEKKSVIFPSQFHEIAAVSEEVQIPDAGKSRRNALCLLR